MALSKVLPLLVMGGTAVHSGGAVKQRALAFLGAKEKWIAKQNMSAMIDSAMLEQANGGQPPDTTSTEGFRRWIKKSIRITGDQKKDPSLDPWGTAYRGSYVAGSFTVTSAGADRNFGSADDLVAKANINDF